MLHGFAVGPFCTTGRAALKEDCQFFKGQSVLMGLTLPQVIQMAFRFPKSVCSR